MKINKNKFLYLENQKIQQEKHFKKRRKFLITKINFRIIKKNHYKFNLMIKQAKIWKMNMNK